MKHFASAYSAGHSAASQPGVCNASIQAHPCTPPDCVSYQPLRATRIELWILLPAVTVGADSQHSPIVVHSLACSSPDVVQNACAAYSALVHANNQRSSRLTLCLEHATMQILPCDDACAQAYSIIDALHGNTYTLHRITTSMHRHCCTYDISLYALHASRYNANHWRPMVTMLSHPLCTHAAACHHVASIMHKDSMSDMSQIDFGAWTLLYHSPVVS